MLDVILPPLTHLTKLSIVGSNSFSSGCLYLRSLEGLQACGQLKNLDISYADVTSLRPLSSCRHLSCLNIDSCAALSSLSPLTACVELEHLSMRGCDKMMSVAPLRACTRLEVLYMDSFKKKAPPALEALKAAMPKLRVDHNSPFPWR
ncbi:hypothetical protein FOA52_013871 [Chlamydomonas sp. UWO 241]|nr:hypothetical protein FOA52_013871 [Chlamydomonas sp. UWO 241]